MRTTPGRFALAALGAALLLGSPESAFAQEPAAPAAEEPAAKKSVEEKFDAAPDEKVISGMSIVGNDEAPKSLVIVPWKTSELGDGLDVDQGVLDGRKPVDRKVFQRELSYYEIRTNDSPAAMADAAP